MTLEEARSAYNELSYFLEPLDELKTSLIIPPSTKMHLSIKDTTNSTDYFSDIEVFIKSNIDGELTFEIHCLDKPILTTGLGRTMMAIVKELAYRTTVCEFIEKNKILTTRG